MFMRFRGGGIGHIGTCSIDSRMRDDNNRFDAKQQDESDSYLQEEWDNSIEEESGAHVECTSHTEPGNEDTDEEQDEEQDTDEEQVDDTSGSTNDSDGEDLDDDLEDEEVMNDDEILDEEGFA